MMNSKIPMRIERAIREIFDLLSEEALQQSCDAPINDAAQSYQLPETDKLTYRLFLETIGSFVQHIYAHGWMPGQALSPPQARAEAIRLLQRNYQGQSAHGFEAAYLDAFNPTFNGLEFIITQLTQIMISKARKRYTNWVLQDRLNCLEWSERVLMANKLMQRWISLGPDNMEHAHPAQLADHCGDLIMAQITADAQLSSIISDDRFLSVS